jgi:ABC-type nitrate/sulfonate/bicarbonate transport system ATPase subunit
MATAASFSAGAGSAEGRRANAAQRVAIFRLVASSNGRIIPLDYNTSAIDEMTRNRKNTSPRTLLKMTRKT